MGHPFSIAELLRRTKAPACKLFDKRIEDPYALPVIFVQLDEFVVVGSFLVPVMVVFGLEDNVQADIPVANIHLAPVRFDQLAGGKEDHAGMVTEVLVAVIDEFCTGGLGVIVQRKVNIVDEMRGFLPADNQSVCAAG